MGTTLNHHTWSLGTWQDGHGRQVESLLAESAVQSSIMAQLANQSLHWIEHLRAWLFGGVS
ncbi:hypothetical protein QUF58_08335 [Anaerolineales bacterium HSG24]|nr:hypothetical protein [Anaerolineales bacterium HSG24]